MVAGQATVEAGARSWKMMETGARVVLFCAAFALLGGAHAQVSDAERQALIDFYHATGGDEWHNNEGWLGEAGSECDWHGVHCLGEAAGDAHVRMVRLIANGLDGELPATLVDLERVTGINLRANRITGPIPPALAELGKLHSLELEGNRLSGSVPAELLASPAYTISLKDNLLDGYAEAEVTPQGSIILDLSGNPIAGLPPASWRDTGALVVLDLSRTALSGPIDFEHHAWPGLQHLSLDDNAITELQGITAGTLTDLRRLSIAGNQLTGAWSVDGLSALEEVYLADNQLHGEDLASLFAIDTLRIIELQRNPLQVLPDELPGAVPPLLTLNLSGTKLSSTPPDWFGDLTLRDLNLSGNLLDGELDPWLAALREDQWVRLDLSRNRFEGPLPQSLLAVNFAHAGFSLGAGLNLCWNAFDEPFASEFETFLADVHLAGSLADCNDRAVTEIDPTLSGSWYNPARSGKGYTVMLLDNGLLMHYWFGYPDAADASFDDQVWSFQLVAPDGEFALPPPSLVPYGGRFRQGLAGGQVWAYGNRHLEFARLADDILNVYSGWAMGGRHIGIDPPPPPIRERFDHQRITRLAGARCDDQSSFQGYSGAWYNPDVDGEGFIVEVLPNDQVVIYWFTFTPDGSGSQAWMIGDGIISSLDPILQTTLQPEAVIEDMTTYRPVGGRLGPDFDAGEVVMTDWGRLDFDFYSEDVGHVSWESTDPDFGSGDYPIERLARPMLAECED
jgi:hypothetical protein